MNKDDVLARIKLIEEEIVKLVQSHASLTGALNEAKHWLATIEKVDAAVEEIIPVVEGVIAD